MNDRTTADELDEAQAELRYCDEKYRAALKQMRSATTDDELDEAQAEFEYRYGKLEAARAQLARFAS